MKQKSMKALINGVRVSLSCHQLNMLFDGGNLYDYSDREWEILMRALLADYVSRRKYLPEEIRRYVLEKADEPYPDKEDYYFPRFDDVYDVNGVLRKMMGEGHFYRILWRMTDEAYQAIKKEKKKARK